MSSREKWCIGLRDAEKEHYAGAEHNFKRDEVFFRLGFEAALHREHEGKSTIRC